MDPKLAPAPSLLSTHQDLSAQELKLKGFKAYQVDTAVNPGPTYRRRDFYKVALMTSHCTVHYADRSIELNGTSLMFANPHIPYSIELHAPRLTGYSCLFTEAYMKENDRSESLHQSPLFKVGGTPIFHLSAEQAAYAQGIFQKILAEQATEYLYKGDLIRTYLQLLIHEALRMQPTESFVQHKNSASRIASLFLELLERQFPIESPEKPLSFKTAQDFAEPLAIHVNHLNRAVKEATGKSTTAHVAERVVGEAKALLHHTDWDVATIGYALGFEYASYFNIFFKKHTGLTPLAFRKAV
ncbi:AraC-type DNA-binding protein [Hymenobacter gelipurpurascens]|uniref:AraC-type DNA-binding protein n=1 Tax=Hymenobacter gelipurpurascens TaxID=89968 RepID=A0A212TH19_9BACT|nr:helix-turn-helix domain-containing protein [Hymenobacter gelipurpurascens]SNC65293.1 AraC-type DNA-binding protein [Hymenobacter gelipurpurascens]